MQLDVTFIFFYSFEVSTSLLSMKYINESFKILKKGFKIKKKSTLNSLR